MRELVTQHNGAMLERPVPRFRRQKYRRRSRAPREGRADVRSRQYSDGGTDTRSRALVVCEPPPFRRIKARGGTREAAQSDASNDHPGNNTREANKPREGNPEVGAA